MKFRVRIKPNVTQFFGRSFVSFAEMNFMMFGINAASNNDGIDKVEIFKKMTFWAPLAIHGILVVTIEFQVPK